MQTWSGMWPLLFCVIYIFNIPPGTSSSGGTQEYCHNEVFTAECQQDEVVIIERANYGRMRLGRCVQTDFGFVGCYTKVLGIVSQRCSGRRACEIRIPDVSFDNTRPCNQDLKSYFEAEYKCQKVITVKDHLCRSNSHLKITSPSGVIASTTTQESGCGSDYNPWIIQGRSGQRLNLTLHDFTETPDTKQAAESFQCLKYATIKDGSSGRQRNICGGGASVKHVYLSETNVVELQLSSANNYNFLIYYEAIGCEDYVPPENTRVHRFDDRVTVGCANSGDIWHLICQDQKWHGDIGNCTVAEETEEQQLVLGGLSFPMGVSILIIVLVAVAIGGVILLFGVCMLRKRGRNADECDHKDVINLHDQAKEYSYGKAVLGPADYHQVMIRTGESPTPENEYAYVWESPRPGQSTLTGTLRAKDPLRLCQARHTVACHELGRKPGSNSSGRCLEKAPQYFELDPDVVVNIGGEKPPRGVVPCPGATCQSDKPAQESLYGTAHGPHGPTHGHSPTCSYNDSDIVLFGNTLQQINQNNSL